MQDIKQKEISIFHSDIKKVRKGALLGKISSTGVKRLTVHVVTTSLG
jgi:hypothetical protein